ncbi:MAG: 3-hydroxyacyl-[acyl-carrier-protein] dehydratase [Planctomycetota bacterium]|jgi:3-hydroxyacyl-[acyl-carrier-protein] dehydratase
MASAPVLDFSTLPLDTVRLDGAGLDPFLQQTGRFRMLDGILHDDVEGKLVVGYKDLTAQDWWAADHVPGRPMFPGALQIEAAAQLSTYDYLAHRVDPENVGERFVGFGGVDKARFRGQVLPDCRLIIATHLLKASRRMFRYLAQGFVEEKMVFEAEVLGVIV